MFEKWCHHLLFPVLGRLKPLDHLPATRRRRAPVKYWILSWVAHHLTAGVKLCYLYNDARTDASTYDMLVLRAPPVLAATCRPVCTRSTQS